MTRSGRIIQKLDELQELLNSMADYGATTDQSDDALNRLTEIRMLVDTEPECPYTLPPEVKP